MSNQVTVNINPKVLEWARMEAGFDAIEIATKLGISHDRYKNWEKNGLKIPLGTLETIATNFKRQLAVFFLPQVPDKIVKPEDYRNLSPADSKLSKKVLMAIRDVNYFRDMALDLQGEKYWNNRYDWVDDAKLNVKDGVSFADWLRELLDVSIDEQMSWKNDSEAYSKWRKAVEDKLGILIFQFSLPVKEVQGFCFSDHNPYSIVVNSNLLYSSRIFTIFHELAHIFRHHSGICLFENATEKQTEEWACNSFAGNFLAPNNMIEKTDNLDEIVNYARQLKVSREVYLRRLKEEKKISDMKFFTLLDAIKATYKTDKKAKGGFALPPEKKSRFTRGETFYNLVLDAVRSNQISVNKASNALDLNSNRILNEI